MIRTRNKGFAGSRFNVTPSAPMTSPRAAAVTGSNTAVEVPESAAERPRKYPSLRGNRRTAPPSVSLMLNGGDDGAGGAGLSPAMTSDMLRKIAG